MWKESYKLGVAKIDYQHKALFDKTQELLAAVEAGASAYTYAQIIQFLKGYVVFHFRDEEAYQAAIGYADTEMHKKQHGDFTRLILDYETRLEADGYSQPLVKNLAGTLTAWLIHHVVHVDLTMVAGTLQKDAGAKMSCLEAAAAGAAETLQAVAGLGKGSCTRAALPRELPDEAVWVSIDLVDGQAAELTFVFARDLAVNLFERMTLQRPEKVDELVCSALAEVTNIAAGTAATRLTEQGLSCSITPPRITPAATALVGEGTVLETELGRLLLLENRGK